ncbi:MAG: RNA 2',3'-cyclic phosphodiesterase [Candidatus Hydrogenedentes bacterium]|nr:RNA 2',3'-cyclic phosphodiesterase [Candidatus Hydrogenedentota bacterium]
MRAFLAIELPDALKTRLVEVAKRLGSSRAPVLWTRPGNMHLTLRFLGDVSDEQGRQLSDYLAGEYNGFERFQLNIAGIGVFPNPRAPRIIWAGVYCSDASLERVQHIAEQGAQRIGLKPEKRAFRPHLTIGRVRQSRKTGSDFRRLLDLEHDFDGGRIDVLEVSLFSSELKPSGAEHTRIACFALS